MGYWWLRSPGYNQSYAASVNSDGSVNRNGWNVDNDNTAVRPAFPYLARNLCHAAGSVRRGKEYRPFSQRETFRKNISAEKGTLNASHFFGDAALVASPRPKTG